MAAFQSCLRIQPDFAKGHNGLGNVLHALGRHEEAVDAYRLAIHLQPDLAEAYSNLGVAVQKLGRWEESIVALKRALELQPHLAVAHYNLGVALAKLDRDEAALAAYDTAIAYHPNFAAAYHNAGALLLATGNLVKAADYLERAIHLQPDFIDALVDLGNAYVRLGRKADARKTFRIVLHLNPNHSIALYNLGATLLEDGQTSEAREMLLRADAIEPGCADVELMRAAQYECRWDEFPERIAKIEKLLKSPQASSREHAQSFRIHHHADRVDFRATIRSSTALGDAISAKAYGFCKRSPSHPALSLKSERSEAKDKLRIGYLSADFHEHATSWLIAELFEAHSRERFEVFGYSIGRDDGGPTRRRLVQAFDHFCDLMAMSDHDAARAIAGKRLGYPRRSQRLYTTFSPQILAFRRHRLKSPTRLSGDDGSRLHRLSSR